MSRKIRLADFGKNPLRAEQIDGDATVLTIASVAETKFDGRPQLEIKFAEFPDNHYFTNVSILGVLVAVLGDDLDNWIGKRVPLEKIQVPNPQVKGSMVTKLYPVDVRDWDSTVKDFDKAVAASKVTRGRKASK
jgi:hypothetical protein